MNDLDRIFHPKYSQNSDYDPFLDDNYFQDIEAYREYEEFLDMTDLDEMDNIFLDED